MVTIAKSVTICETARLRLREIHAADTAAIDVLFADANVMAHYANAMSPAAGGHWRAAVESSYAAYGFGPWTVELHDGTFLGQCGPLAQTVDGVPELEAICFLLRPYWRSGYADEAGRAAIEQIFERTRARRVVGLIVPANRPSKRLALRLGMRFDRDVVHDGAPMGLYARPRSNP